MVLHKRNIIGCIETFYVRIIYCHFFYNTHVNNTKQPRIHTIRHINARNHMMISIKNSIISNGSILPNWSPIFHRRVSTKLSNTPHKKNLNTGQTH